MADRTSPRGAAPRPTADRDGADAARATRRRRRVERWAGSVVAGVVMLIAALFLISAPDLTNPKPGPGETVGGQRLTARTLAGIPQAGDVLGDPRAPVTIVEFADLQCPICKAFARQELPQVLTQEVRTGRAKLQLRLVSILDRGGHDSSRLAAVADAAGRQQHLFDVAELVYLNQGGEGTGYATDAYLRRILGGVGGLNAARALADRGDPAITRLPAGNLTALKAAGGRGTPTVLVGRTGGPLERVDRADASSIRAAVDRAVAG